MLGWITKWISLERFGIWFIVTMEQESTSDYHSLESLVHHSSRLYLHWNECHSSCWSCWLWLLCTSQCASWGEMSLKKALCTSLNKVKTYLGTNTFILSNTKWKEIVAHHTVHAYLCMLQQSTSNPAAMDTDRRSRGNVSDTWRLHCVDILLLLKKHQSRYHRQQLACSNAHNSLDLGGCFFHLVKVKSFGMLKQNKGLTMSPHTDRQTAGIFARNVSTKNIRAASSFIKLFNFNATLKPASQCWGSQNISVSSAPEQIQGFH